MKVRVSSVVSYVKVSVICEGKGVKCEGVICEGECHEGFIYLTSSMVTIPYPKKTGLYLISDPRRLNNPITSHIVIM